jgi:hypothetical protein
MTLANISIRVGCLDCMTGPDEVHLTMTSHGTERARGGGEAGWSIMLFSRPGGGSYFYRHGRGPRVGGRC